MDIFTFAMEIEKNSEKYYRELARTCTHPGLRRILDMLADDEVRHYQTVKAMRDGSPADIEPSQILTRARREFSDSTAPAEDVCFSGDEIKIYRQALEKEIQAENYYLEKAADIDDPRIKKILRELADQEARHRYLMENMIEFLSRPAAWIENAEFNHLDEY